MMGTGGDRKERNLNLLSRAGAVVRGTRRCLLNIQRIITKLF